MALQTISVISLKQCHAEISVPCSFQVQHHCRKFKSPVWNSFVRPNGGADDKQMDWINSQADSVSRGMDNLRSNILCYYDIGHSLHSMSK